MLNEIRQRHHERGFSLIELAAVVLVIMIIALIAIPAYNLFQERTRGNTIDSSAEALGSSIFTLATQVNRTANHLDDIEGSYFDLPQSDQDVLRVAVSAVSVVPGAATGGGTYVDRHAIVFIQQQFGDRYRAGCLFLPPNESSGQTPIWRRHGTDLEENPVVFVDASNLDGGGEPEQTIVYNIGFVDVTEGDCQDGNEPDDSPEKSGDVYDVPGDAEEI